MSWRDEIDHGGFKGDGSANIANKHQAVVQIDHIPSGHSVKFKAMMTQFEDSYTSEWNSEAVYGRMDPLQTFQRTGRAISIGFNVAAFSEHEAADNLARISSLIQFLYPSYDSAGLLKGSPFCRIRFMNWSQVSGEGSGPGLLGTIGGFTYSPDLDLGVFPSTSGAGGRLHPKLVNVSFQFTVIHEHKLGWDISDSVPLFRGGWHFPYQHVPSYESNPGMGTEIDVIQPMTEKELEADKALIIEEVELAANRSQYLLYSKQVGGEAGGAVSEKEFLEHQRGEMAGKNMDKGSQESISNREYKQAEFLKRVRERNQRRAWENLRGGKE